MSELGSRTRLWGWLGPMAVALLALALRLHRLGRPEVLVFDETYYAKDAWSLLQHGYVQDFVDDADERIVAGDLTGLMTGEPSQVVHPEAGKWLIALGEAALGMDSVGWRVAAAVVGALTVLVLARLVRRLTGSTWVGCLAGLLLCLDGLHLVMSRTALLDVFLTFWLVCAVACLVADRDWVRERVERFRPLRPWQLLAGLCFGLACGTKWSGLAVLAGFGLLVVGWEVLARRRHGTPGWVRTTLVVGVPAFLSLVGVALVVYLLTWTGWLLHADVHAQRFGLDQGNPLRALWDFHRLNLDFHTGDYLAAQSHPYASHPAGWLLLDRPVAFDVRNDLPAASCGAPADSSCLREVTALGNPVVWWSGALALVAAAVAWVRTRDGRWAVPLVGVGTTWLPWFASTDRPIFSFYAVAVLPFTVVALALVVDLVRTRVRTPRGRYGLGLAVGLLVLATVVAFWYFHPVLTGALLPYDSWRQRMWFSRWV